MISATMDRTDSVGNNNIQWRAGHGSERADRVGGRVDRERPLENESKMTKA